MGLKKKSNIIIALISVLIMAVTVPGKPSDFGHSDNPSYYKVRKFLICSICYVGYHTDKMGVIMGIDEWKPCGFGILGMTFKL